MAQNQASATTPIKPFTSKFQPFGIVRKQHGKMEKLCRFQKVW